MSDATCAGTGRRWITGTVATHIICPECHRGYKSMGAPKPRRSGRPLRFGPVPAHEDGRAVIARIAAKAHAR